MEAVAFKIVDAAEWREAVAEGAYAGSAVDRADGYIHLSTADQLSETARKHYAGRENLMLLTVDLSRLEDTIVWEPSRGGALFPHIYGPLPVTAVTEAAPSRRPDGSVRRRDGHVRPRRRGPASSRPRDRPRPGHSGAEVLPLPTAPADDPILATTVAGLSLPNPIGLAAGLDKNAEALARPVAARLRLRRMRLGHPPAPGRQSQAAAVPPQRGPGGHQPHGLQQRRAGGLRRPPGAPPAPAPSSGPISGPTRTPTTAPPTMSPACSGLRAWPTISPSTSPRPTRRACAPCRARGAGRSAGPRRRGAAARRAPGLSQDRARSDVRRDRA